MSEQGRPTNRRNAAVSLLLIGLVAAVVVYFFAYGFSFRGFPAPVPWVAVWNYGPSAVTVQLWDGGRTFTAQCGVKEGFPADAEWQFPPPPPWHVQVRDAGSATMLAETSVWGYEGWQLAYVHPNGSVSLTKMQDRDGSWDGPAFCARAAFSDRFA